ncbi:MAG: aminoacyl-tRNA hydrolase [Chloroherpetonaceae bacterium]|nr:aminoacyl-tRNA hydrolase [Chloroherpetonaceae bacterium]
MKLICGLGNPEPRYDGTRHNIGFAIVDALAHRFGAEFRAGKGDYLLSKIALNGVDVLLQKPTTYMNLSGKAVQHALAFYKISVGDLLVICDDVNLPLGAARLRPDGSDGGQNGLKDIIQRLGRKDFARLRVGIGAPKDRSQLSDYVLSKFTSEETPIVQETIEHCVKAVLSFIEDGISIAMTRFNRSPKSPASNRNANLLASDALPPPQNP